MKFYNINGKKWLSNGNPVSRMIHMDVLMGISSTIPYDLKSNSEKFLNNQLNYHGLQSAVIHAKRTDYLLKDLQYKVVIIRMNHEALGINCSHPNALNTKLVQTEDFDFIEYDCLYCLSHVKETVSNVTNF